MTARVSPELRGPVAVLAQTVAVLATVVVVGELLGTVGLFRLAPFVIAMVLAGFATSAAARRIAEPRDSAIDDAVARPSSLGSWGSIATVVAVATVAGAWCTRVVDSLRHGMLTADTLWYHMPVAARFVQTGSTSHLHFVDGTSLTAFFPASSELLHGVGILLFGNDVLSPWLNIGWLALALLAGWCIGAPGGVAPLTLVGTAIVLGTPELVLDDPGGALNDVVAIALLLASIALLVHVVAGKRVRTGTVVFAALAAGLAAGTKFTMLAPVAALTVFVAVGLQRPRLRRLAWWLGAMFVAGGYWYVRNLVRTGSPLPSLRLGVGPVHLPSAPTQGQDALAKYLTNRADWDQFFHPGLRLALGALWWLILAFAIAGLVGVIVVRSSRRYWWLGFVGFTSLAAYVLAPQILVLNNRPFWFAVNVRYMAPGLILGLVALPLVLLRRRNVCRYLLGAYLLTLLVSLADRTLWRSDLRTVIAAPTQGAVARVIGVAVAIGCLAVGAVLLVRPLGARRVPVVAGGAVILVVAVAGFGVGNAYLHRRYTHLAGFAWARHVHDSRIAIINLLTQYQLYGADLSNHVQYVAARGPHGRSREIASCVEWRTALRDGRYAYAVITTPDQSDPGRAVPRAVGWTQSDPGARLLLHARNGAVSEWTYALRRPPDPSTCPPPTRAPA